MIEKRDDRDVDDVANHRWAQVCHCIPTVVVVVAFSTSFLLICSCQTPTPVVDLVAVVVALALIIHRLMSTNRVETKTHMLKMMTPEVDAPQEMQLTRSSVNRTKVFKFVLLLLLFLSLVVDVKDGCCFSHSSWWSRWCCWIQILRSHLLSTDDSRNWCWIC